MRFKTHYILVGILMTISLFQCTGQGNQGNPLLGGPCEGCEAIYEYDQMELRSVDTLPNFEKTSPKLLLTGKVLKQDGKSPAEGVILYIYHTNRKGLYEKNGSEKGWARRHGYIRGWIKTGPDGSYSFYTFRPASYPDRPEPEHIHVTVKEPNKKEYYIEDFLFTDDPLLTSDYKKKLKKRAGSGVVSLTRRDGMLIAERDIILGLNIPNYN